MMRKLAFLILLAFIFVIPTEKILLFSGIGSIGKVLGMLAMATWGASALLRGEIRRLNLFHVVVVLFVLWNAASMFWSVDGAATFGRIITWFQLALLVVMIWDLFSTHDSIKLGLQAYVLGGLFAAAGTIYNYVSSVEFVYGRYSSAGQHAVDLGLLLALGIPIAWYLSIQEYNNSALRRLLKLLNLLSLPLACIGIALTLRQAVSTQHYY